MIRPLVLVSLLLGAACGQLNDLASSAQQAGLKANPWLDGKDLPALSPSPAPAPAPGPAPAPAPTPEPVPAIDVLHGQTNPPPPTGCGDCTGPMTSLPPPATVEATCAGITRVTLVESDGTDAKSSRLPLNLDIEAPATAAAICRTILELPARTGVQNYACMYEMQINYHMTFIEGAIIAFTADVDPTGCQTITTTFDEKIRNTNLDYWTALANDLNAPLGTVWPYAPVWRPDTSPNAPAQM